MRLSLQNIGRLPDNVQKQLFDLRRLKHGIVHLGPGNFHRAHQAVFTEDAVAAEGGDWGILGISLKSTAVVDALSGQNGLYTVETLGERRRHRVIGILREVTAAGRSETSTTATLAVPHVHIVTLTVTEKGYCLDASGALNFSHPDVRHDLETENLPRSAVGWLVRGLDERRLAGGGNLTIISCDNLVENGPRLARAVAAFAVARDGALAQWIEDHACFPRTMVDCIVPAGDDALRKRVEAELGVTDAAPVMREEFAQWVVEDRFAGPRPSWEAAGAEIVKDVAPFERLKLHILNAAHSALAYMGLARGHRFVREAIRDPDLSTFLDALVADEIAPRLAPLESASYWRSTRARFANPHLDHRLEQIAEDGSVKLAQRVFPVLIDNARAGRPCDRLASIVRAWLEFARSRAVVDPAGARIAAWAAAHGTFEDALNDEALFPAPFRTEPRVRTAILR